MALGAETQYMDKFTTRELSIIGAVLYNCEGTRLRKDKRRKNDIYYWVIEFTNSEPNIIKLFLNFLRKIIKIDETRLKAQLFIHEDLKKEELEKFWSKITKISAENFNKTMILKSKNLKFKVSPYGTLKIRYHSKEAFQKLALLINKVF